MVLRVDDEGGVLRQIEHYDSGVRLCYGEQHMEDEFGGLSQAPLDLFEPGYTASSLQDFEAAWSLSLICGNQPKSVFCIDHQSNIVLLIISWQDRASSCGRLRMPSGRQVKAYKLFK